MRKKGFWALASLAAVWGCGSSGSNYTPVPTKPVQITGVKPGEEATLFPLTEGNQWTYSGEIGRRIDNKPATAKFETTFKVTKLTKTPNGTRADIVVTTNMAGAPDDHQIWLLNDKGLYQLAVGNPSVFYEPPQPVILFPADAERKFIWKGKGITPGAKLGTQTLESRILEPQEVDTDGGRFSAIGVESKGTFAVGAAKGRVTSLAFWSPKVGLVRYSQAAVVGNNQVVQNLRLKASTIR